MNKPAKPPIIRANVLASVVAEVLRRGGEVEHLLRTHIETVDTIRNPYQEIPLARYLAFFEAAADLVGDLYLGAHIGARFQPEELGPLGVIFISAPSLHAALNRFGFFLQTWQGGTTVELELRVDTAEWIYQIDDPALRPRRQDAEFSLSATCGFIRTLLGARWAPIEVHFEHSAPRGWEPQRNALTTFFRAPVLFDQSVNRLLIERNDLARPVSTSKQALAPYLEQHLRDLMSGSSDDETFSAKVSYVISKRLGRRSIDLPSIAVELGVSQRTLQRRLREEGSSLRQLVRDQRARIAEPLLQGGATPIMSIAHNLGYADPTVFSRAFKAWRGRSPREFRREPGEE